MSRKDRIVVFVLNMFACFPGFMYYLSSVYDSESPRKIKFLGKQTSFSLIFFIVTLVIIPLFNFYNQSRLQKFRFALRLSQTALFCALINSFFYIASLSENAKETTRKYLPSRNKGLAFIATCVIFLLVCYATFNPEFDTILDLSKEVKVCKNKHLDIESLSNKAQSDDILHFV